MTIVEALRGSHLLSHLDIPTLVRLLDEAVQISGEAGAPVHARPADVAIVVKGAMKVATREGELIATIRAKEARDGLAILHGVPNGARLELLEPSEVLVVDGAVLDAALSKKHQTDSISTLESPMAERVTALLTSLPFSEMPLDQLCRCASAMQEVSFNKGDEVIRYADRGDHFYVIHSGEAEVWRTDLSSGKDVKVATLGAGAAFGEEALLSGALRNATVRMTKPGRLYALSQDDFNHLLAGSFVREIEPEAARLLVTRGEAELIDCRYRDEHEIWRIPGSISMPLDTIRNMAGELKPSKQYLVYCRTGRRSRAAAYLLAQRGVTCSVMRGGISSWPYEYEGDSAQQLPGVPTL